MMMVAVLLPLLASTLIRLQLGGEHRAKCFPGFIRLIPSNSGDDEVDTTDVPTLQMGN